MIADRTVQPYTGSEPCYICLLGDRITVATWEMWVPRAALRRYYCERHLKSREEVRCSREAFARAMGLSVDPPDDDAELYEWLKATVMMWTGKTLDEFMAEDAGE
jgi:hypothetical protein